MDLIERLAEDLLNAENPPFHDPQFYQGQRMRLSDLWECDQERYRRMAEAALRARQSQEAR